MSLCDGKDHLLEEVLRAGTGNHGFSVVMWCRGCGAIVVDFEYDRRVQPGRVKEMEFPELARRMQGKEVP